jgi:hypothetical protein
VWYRRARVSTFTAVGGVRKLWPWDVPLQLIRLGAVVIIGTGFLIGDTVYVVLVALQSFTYVLPPPPGNFPPTPSPIPSCEGSLVVLTR